MDAEITRELLDRVAQNARLELTPEEKTKFLSELREIIAAFSAIDDVDTAGIDISLQSVALKNIVREDEPKKGLTREEALSLTEHQKDGYFKGPKVV